jgi:hypothetical protein
MDKNLKLRYKMDEGAGLRAFDSSGLQRYGTLSGTTKPAWQVGPKGRCLYFGGAGYVATPSFGLTGTVVVFAAAVRCLGSSRQTILGDGATSATVGFLYLVRWDAQGINDLYWGYANGAGYSYAASTNYFAGGYDDAWLHLCVVCDYTGARSYFYRNGISVGSPVAMTGTPVFPSTDRVKSIGRYSSGTYLLVNGYLANVQLWTLATMPPLAVANASVQRMNQGLWPIW